MVCGICGATDHNRRRCPKRDDPSITKTVRKLSRKKAKGKAKEKVCKK